MRWNRSFRGALAPILWLACGVAAGATRADVLGDVEYPLRVSQDDRRLEDILGRPFLVNGDAAWSLMVVPTEQEAEAYLENRRQKGFNAVLVNLIERGFGGPEDAAGNPPFLTPNDFTTPNEAYFAHADRVIDMAAAKGMLVLLTPAYLGIQCGSQGWCEQMLDQPVSAMTTYGRYLGNRYRSRRNILWVHGGDTPSIPHGVDGHVNAIANGIREMDQGALHTGHCSRQNSAIECYDEPWLDVNTTYSNCDATLTRTLDDYERIPTQAFFYIEGRYESDPGDLGCVIDQEAWAVLGGASGHVFGNNPIWRFGDGWQDELDSVGAKAMAHLSDLFLSRAWFRLVPDLGGTVLVSGASDDAIAAQTSDGESILVYVPTSRNITVDLTDLSSNTARAWWFDPGSGAISALGTMPATGTRSFSAPGRRVLVIDDVLKSLPEPGSAPYPIPEPAGAPELYAAAGAALCGWLRRRARRA
jgi:hypothetical protein